MFFTLSKILGFVAIPSNDLILLGLLGLLLLATPFRLAGIKVMGVAIAALAIAAFSPLGNYLILPLENRFPPWDPSRGPPTGIIVLGGALSPEQSAYRHEPQLNEAAERITAAVDLALRYKTARVVYTGGSSGLIFDAAKEADYALVLLQRMGIDRGRILVERRSRNTAENASYIKALVNPRPGERWLLVTSAAHMPRSIGIFRKAGFAVEPYPVDWRTRGQEDITMPFYLASGGLARVDAAMHEWVGLLVYWMTDRTADLFPAPQARPPVNRNAADRDDRRP
jgi:uncharacterized SAM-binding protein YcdF (DUF218 family)